MTAADEIIQENEALKISFKLRWDADMRAIKRWQKETGHELTWPDHADLVVWLLQKLEEEQKRCAKIAREWKSSLRPGTRERLYGHQEAAREIAKEIEGSA